MRNSTEIEELLNAKLHHIGIVVKDISFGIEVLNPLNLTPGTGPESDAVQKVTASFVKATPDCDVYLELLEPSSPDSPISGHLAKGGGLHHLCFEVDDIALACDKLVEKEYRLVTGPVACPGIDRSFGSKTEGARIAFFLTPMKLLIELVEI